MQIISFSCLYTYFNSSQHFSIRFLKKANVKSFRILILKTFLTKFKVWLGLLLSNQLHPCCSFRIGIQYFPIILFFSWYYEYLPMKHELLPSFQVFYRDLQSIIYAPSFFNGEMAFIEFKASPRNLQTNFLQLCPKILVLFHQTIVYSSRMS